jgi:hypothetical protein
MVPVDTINAADVISVLFVEKNQTEDLTVFTGQLRKNLANVLFLLAGHQLDFGIRILRRRVERRWDWSVPGDPAVLFGQHVVADRVNKGANSFRIG